VNLRRGFVMGNIIAIFNQKGGIGKSTTTMNLGWALINKGKKVLLIDLDPQSSLTISMHFEPHLMETTIYDVLNGQDIRKNVITDNENFFFVPSNINLSGAEVELTKKPRTLEKCLKPISDYFDYIIIDCPPSLGNLSINALVASDGVIVPMETQFLCWEGYELLKNTVEQSKALNPKLKIIGLLATMHKKNNHNKQVLEIIRETGLAFNTVIPDRVAFQDATVEGVPVGDMEKELGTLYDELAQEVINRGY
jgi:chromosome partitioning protein